ncbi:hypothetical protein OG897_30625 [Streptomyces sp. NBC_00237]|uniref:hypothetical protein n=1 Tax=Streptomyces sp. NBC_00237 TaxID=2975687 RepID=UPI00224FA003|nr:hypothetical protein [Streptomyces sp. NBC_00237]MCX5205791.1 hypothetical protein [Streptomyces sp. NBC_00237]
MIPLILLGATVLGAGVIFGFSSFVVGIALLAGGVLGLLAFIGAQGRQMPGEREKIVDERHYIGGNDDHRRHYDGYDHHRG